MEDNRIYGMKQDVETNGFFDLADKVINFTKTYGFIGLGLTQMVYGATYSEPVHFEAGLLFVCLGGFNEDASANRPIRDLEQGIEDRLQKLQAQQPQFPQMDPMYEDGHSEYETPPPNQIN